MDFSTLHYLAFGSLSVCIAYLTAWWLKRTPQLPPGPKGWPFFGFVPFILAEKPAKYLTKVQEKYGNVFSFYVGNTFCIVLSDYTSVKENFSKKSLQSRPPKYFRTSGYKNFSELDVAEWDIHRKFISNTFKVLGVGKSRFEEIVQDELSRVIPKLETYVNKPSCNIRDVVATSINNTIIQLICSRWFDENHPFMRAFQCFLARAAESFSNNMAFLYYPWIEHVLNFIHPHYRAINSSLAEMKEFVTSEIRSREKTHNENSTHDYIDLYLNEMKAGKYDSNLFNVDNLIANSLFLLMAGSDTTRNSLEWLLLAMARYPDIQKKVHDEIISTIGPERPPSYEDRGSLPYTEAAILESERWKTLAPLSCLRWTTEETVIQGYNIPKHTVVMNNLQRCHQDPKYWDSPKEFRPERFLAKDKSKIVIPESFLPFSLGRRNCPGDKMASIEMFLYFTVIMQKYQLAPPEEGLCLKGQHRINMQAEKPVLRVLRR